MKKFTGGFGTSLCWFANIDYPEDVKKNIHNLLFTKEGLGLNIIRYNLGGGSDPSKKQNLRPGANVPCISNENDGIINPLNDPFQLSFLDKAVKQGTVNKVELFSNSPPYWMTNSGFTNGSVSSFKCNLRKEKINDFSKFLVDSYNQLKKEYPVVSLSPFNEPSNPYWMTNFPQEGCYYNYSMRNKVLSKIKEIDSSVYVSACEEFSPIFQLLWAIFGKHSKYDRVNVHGYHLIWKNITFYFDDFNFMRKLIRRFTKKDLWMSEYGWGYSDEMKDSIKLARSIFRDFETYRPEAWCFWQVVENYGNDWGLIQTDFSNPKELTVRRMYYIFKHFTQTLKVNDNYRVVNKNVMYIESENHHKFIILNDTPNNKTIDFINDSKIKAQILDPEPVSVIITSSESIYTDTKTLNNIFPKFSITSIILNK